MPNRLFPSVVTHRAAPRSLRQTGILVTCGRSRLLLRWVLGTALLVLVIDESLKTFARTQLMLCDGGAAVECEHAELGPLWLLRANNAGSAMGVGQGWALWLLLAFCGVLLILVYTRWLLDCGWPARFAIGLQLGGAVANLLDRLAGGGATDVLYVGWGPICNLADIALGVGAVLATWRLASVAACPDRTPRP